MSRDPLTVGQVWEPDILESFPTLSVQELEELPEPSWLVDGLVPEGLGVLYGPPSSFKSFVALDLALAVAAGVPFLGREVAQGGVLYVCPEGAAGLGRRARAWRMTNPHADVSGMRVLRRSVDLIDEREVRLLEATLAELPSTPKLLIIDTLARAMPAGDENSARDIGRVVQALDALPVDSRIVVHHTAKAEGSSERGSGALRGAADVMLAIEREAQSMTCTVTCAKAPKDGEAWQPIHLRAQPEGSSLVMRPVGPVHAHIAAEQARQQAVLDYVSSQGQASGSQIEREVTGKATAIRQTVSGLVAERRLQKERVGRGFMYSEPRPAGGDEVGTGWHRASADDPRPEPPNNPEGVGARDEVVPTPRPSYRDAEHGQIPQDVMSSGQVHSQDQRVMDHG